MNTPKANTKTKKDQKRGPLNYVAFFVDHPQTFEFTPGNSTYYNFHPQPFPYLPIVWVFYWNSLIQKEVWAMTSSEWELYVAAKFVTNFKHLGSQYFLLILDKKTAYYKISKERRIAIASVIGLYNLILNLRIIILLLITKLIFKYKSP